jgi:hypothetical protein
MRSHLVLAALAVVLSTIIATSQDVSNPLPVNGSASQGGANLQYTMQGPSFPAPTPTNPVVTSSNLASIGSGGTGTVNVSLDVSDWPFNGWVKIYSGIGTGGSFEISGYARVSSSSININFRDATGSITPSNGGTVQLWSQTDNLYSNVNSSDIGALGGHGTGTITVTNSQNNVKYWPPSGWVQIFTNGMTTSYELSHFTKVDNTHITIDTRDPGGTVVPINGATLSLIVTWIRFTTAAHCTICVTGDGRVGIGDAPRNNILDLFGGYQSTAGSNAAYLDLSNVFNIASLAVTSLTSNLNAGTNRAHFGNYDINDTGGYLTLGTFGNTKTAGFNFTGPAAARITDGDFFSTTRIGSLQYSDPQVSKTSNYQIVKLDGGNTFDNNGAVGEVDLTLPTSANTYAGMIVSADVAVAQNVKIIAGSGVTINIGTTTSAIAGNVISNAVGSHLTLKALSPTSWTAKESTGTWTVN